jgi:hypothetical protein
MIHPIYNYVRGRGKKPEIQQPYTGEPEEPGEGTDLHDLIPHVTTEDTAARAARTKRDTAAGPDEIMRKHVTWPEIQESLRLVVCFVIACGHQPISWKRHRTNLLKQGKDPARVES